MSFHIFLVGIFYKERFPIETFPIKHGTGGNDKLYIFYMLYKFRQVTIDNNLNFELKS
jgi:hypothetical protein